MHYVLMIVYMWFRGHFDSLIYRNKCKEVMQCEETPTQFILLENGILISYMNSSVVEYDFDGQRKIKMDFTTPVLLIDTFKVEHKGINGFMVALKNKEIKFFHKGNMLFYILAEDNISSFRFGQFKGEDMALAMILKNKTIQVHILKRNFSCNLDDQGRKKLEDGFSKKSKAYVDCLRRERLNSAGNYNVFNYTGIYDRFQRMDLLSKICHDRKLVAPYASMPMVVDLNIEVNLTSKYSFY